MNTAEQSIAGLSFRKSSYSGNNTNCIEVAGAGDTFAVRDTKDRSGPVLAFDSSSWAAFVGATARGDFK